MTKVAIRLDELKKYFNNGKNCSIKFLANDNVVVEKSEETKIIPYSIEDNAMFLSKEEYESINNDKLYKNYLNDALDNLNLNIQIF